MNKNGPVEPTNMSGEGSGPNVKVWIGNLDSKLTEYQLLKIVERYGACSFPLEGC